MTGKELYEISRDAWNRGMKAAYQQSWDEVTEHAKAAYDEVAAEVTRRVLDEHAINLEAREDT